MTTITIEESIKLIKAYQEAFRIGMNTPPPPDAETLLEFRNCIDLTSAENTGKQAWLWKRKVNKLWKKSVILSGTYSSYGREILNAYNR